MSRRAIKIEPSTRNPWKSGYWKLPLPETTFVIYSLSVSEFSALLLLMDRSPNRRFAAGASRRRFSDLWYSFRRPRTVKFAAGKQSFVHLLEIPEMLCRHTRYREINPFFLMRRKLPQASLFWVMRGELGGMRSVPS